jgi:glycosyltransferase involved in cell wall biosynthesis
VINVLLIADRSFATRERDLLGRVQVGFADEGVRPLFAEPWHEEMAESHGMIDRLVYEPAAPLASVGSRAARLLDDLEDLHGSDVRPDVIHCWGDGAVAIGAYIADLLRAPVVVEIWTRRLIPRLRNIERRVVHQGGAGPMLWSAPSEAMLALINHSGVVSPSRCIPWGVHTRKRRTRNKGDRATLALVASGDDSHAIARCIEGVAKADDKHNVMMMLDSAAMRDHRTVWGAAKRAGALDRISIIPDMETRRELILEADIFLQPEVRGEIRSITLDALASGMLVIAAADEVSDALNSGAAIALDDPDAQMWSEAISVALRRLHSDAEPGAAGREFVERSRGASRHISTLIDAYESLLTRASAPE